MAFNLTETIIRKEVALIACHVKNSTDYERKMRSAIADKMVERFKGDEFTDIDWISMSEIRPAVLDALGEGWYS